MFAKARKSVIQEFLEKYNYLERELRNVEVNVSQIQVLVEEETAGESVEDHVFNSNAYNKDRAEYVRIMAQKFLGKAATFEALKPLVEGQLELAVNTLNDLQARIPMLDSEARYKPCRDKCSRLRGELALFGSMEIWCMRLS
ncbi:unnamed protein product, partial [Pocillopora meandrina]